MSGKGIKRGIMVPVLTLAVCAVALVGMGFALTTSVTSNNNTVEKLMVDLDKDYSNLNNQTDADDDIVDKLFDLEITSVKTSNAITTVGVAQNDGTITYTHEIGGATINITETNIGTPTYGYTVSIDENTVTPSKIEDSGKVTLTYSYTDSITSIKTDYITVISGNKASTSSSASVTYDANGGFAFLKTFGNMAGVTLSVKNATAPSSNIKLSLFTVTYQSNKYTINEVASANITGDTEVYFKQLSSGVDYHIECNKVYMVGITEVGNSSSSGSGYSITYSADSSSSITSTLSGTFGLTSGISLDLTFTALA